MLLILWDREHFLSAGSAVVEIGLILLEKSVGCVIVGTITKALRSAAEKGKER